MEPRADSYIHVAHEASDTSEKHNGLAAKRLARFKDYDTPEFQKKLREGVAASFPHTSLEEVLETIQTPPELMAAQ